MNPKRVSNAYESNGVVLGDALNFIYKGNTTLITDLSNRTTVYQFNNYGNTVTINDSEGNALYYEYNRGTNINNKLSLESKLQKTTKNYLKNHNFEQNRDWYQVQGLDSTGIADYNRTTNFNSSQCIRIYKPEQTGATYFEQPVQLATGKTYTLSVYIKTGSFNSLTDKGAGIQVIYKNNQGAEIVKSSKLKILQQEWSRETLTFELPIDSVDSTVKVRLVQEGAIGESFFDCIQLEDGKTANRYNFIENGDFSNGIEFWSASNSNHIQNSDQQFKKGLDTNTVLITPDINGGALNQRVYVSGKAGDVITFGGWAKANSVPIKSMAGSTFYNTVTYNITLYGYDNKSIQDLCSSCK